MDWSPRPTIRKQPSRDTGAIGRHFQAAETSRARLLKDAANLREEAARSRRLAQDVADRRLQANLLQYAIDLESRATRMEGAMNSQGALTPGPAPDEAGK